MRHDTNTNDSAMYLQRTTGIQLMLLQKREYIRMVKSEKWMDISSKMSKNLLNILVLGVT